MTKFTVTDTALKAGEPWGHAPIHVELVDSTGAAVSPAYVDATGVLVEAFDTVADGDGVFTLTLDSTADISPTGCFYLVRIGDADNIISGDDGDGTVRGLRASTPTVLGSTATFDGLADVNMAGKADGDVPTWDTTTGRYIPGTGGGGGGVSSVSGTAPITSTGGATPAIGITAATSGAAGSMSAADKSKLDGVEAGATADQSAAELLAAVKTVDGTGSGLDADLLDGQHASAFEAAGAVTAHTGAVDPHGDRAYAAGLVDDLSGVTNAASARTALGLGTAAVVDTGTGATNAILGNDSRLSDTRTPTAGSVVDNSVASNAAIALSKLASISTARILGRTTAGSGAIEELTTADSFVSAASDTTAGKVELAIASEVNAGTDATRAVTPDALAGSEFGVKLVEIMFSDMSTAITTGDGKAGFVVPASLNGHNLIRANAGLLVAQSSSGTPTIQIRNATQAADMLSTRITIDINESTSYTAATPSVVDTANDDVATGDLIMVDVDVAGTGAKGGIAILEFQLP